MKESDLHLFWLNELPVCKQLKTVDAKKIEIINPGKLNSDSGPDFLHAEIKIDGQLWVGQVEIHISESSWFEHGHHNDPSYNHIILHVVFETQNLLTHTPTLCLANYFSTDQIESIVNDHKQKSAKAEAEMLVLAKSKVNSACYEEAIIRRLDAKSKFIFHGLDQYRNDWEQVFYLLLAKNFGFRTNEMPFEWMARQTPVQISRKHSNNRDCLEALFFGQSGLIPQNPAVGSYEFNLSRQYQLLVYKHNLKPIDGNVWKFMRMRPFNFPTIRLSQFAAINQKIQNMVPLILEAESISQIETLFQAKANHYWDNKYSFKRNSPFKIKKIGDASIRNILINTVVPFLYAYSAKRGKKSLKTQALNLLSKIPPEQNEITRKWSKVGLIAKNALESQALKELWMEPNQLKNA